MVCSRSETLAANLLKINKRQLNYTYKLFIFLVFLIGIKLLLNESLFF